MQQPDTCIRNARGEWIPTNGTKDTPVFRWPPRVAQSLKWVFSYPGFLWPWSTIYLLITIFIWFHFQPAVPRCVEFKPGWIALLFLRNLGLAWVIYGGWHLLLYMLKLQGTNRKYDIRWPSRNDPKFLFHNQTLDNIFWSCASGCTIWTAYEVIYFWALANGKLPYVYWSAHPVYCAVWMCLIPFWRDFHFYWVHRLIHWGPLYKYAHSVHHRNTNPGPWSGLSMHPIEHLLYFSSVSDSFCRPLPPPSLPFQQRADRRLRPRHRPSRLRETSRAKRRSPPALTFTTSTTAFSPATSAARNCPFDRWFGTYRRSLTAKSRPQQ